jgi:hypothetical protein
VWLNLQNTQTHRNTHTNLLLCFQLQSPKQLPWHHRKRNIRARAPRCIENAIADRKLGIPALSIEFRFPRFFNGSALHPQERRAGNHDGEEGDDAEPDEGAECAIGEAQERDAE